MARVRRRRGAAESRGRLSSVGKKIFNARSPRGVRFDGAKNRKLTSSRKVRDALLARAHVHGMPALSLSLSPGDVNARERSVPFIQRRSFFPLIADDNNGLAKIIPCSFAFALRARIRFTSVFNRYSADYRVPRDIPRDSHLCEVRYEAPPSRREGRGCYLRIRGTLGEE
jgi:hypothetical protein